MTQIVYNKNGIAFDIDAIATDINGKADKDLLNTDTDRGVLVESYVNGTSWYRVYSDGWCEQGGQRATGTSAASQSYTIDLLKNFKDTNYFITAVNYYSSANADTNSTYTIAQSGKTSSLFVIFQYGTTGTSGFYWQACGYIS